MRLKFFVIPSPDYGLAELEVNNFIASHRVLELVTNFNTAASGGTWHICIKYIEGSLPAVKNANSKVDYKEILEPSVFALFSKLRVVRKKLADGDAVPAYVVFTDEELAAIARLDTLSEKTLLSVNGIGEKKLEKYGSRLIEMVNSLNNDQAHG